MGDLFWLWPEASAAPRAPDAADVERILSAATQDTVNATTGEFDGGATKTFNLGSATANRANEDGASVRR